MAAGQRDLRQPWKIRLRRRSGTVTAVLAGAVAIAAAAWIGHSYVPAWGNGPTGAGSTDTASAPTGPFAGTPAEEFPGGEAGLVMPPAAACEGWAEAEVASALAQVRQVLAGIYLDRRLLVGRDPTAVTALLAPSSREGLTKLYREPGEGANMPMISPQARLADEPPRLRGTTTFQTVTDGDLRPLEIVTNFVVAYPFQARYRGPGSQVALSHLELTWRVYHEPGVATEDQGLWFREFKGYVFNMDCAEAKRGFLAPASSQLVVDPDVAEGEDQDGYYDPARDLSVSDTCSGSSRRP